MSDTRHEAAILRAARARFATKSEKEGLPFRWTELSESHRAELIERERVAITAYDAARGGEAGGEKHLRALVQRLYEERNRNCEIAVGLAERIHHELDDYGAYVRAHDELVGDDDAEVDAALSQHPEPRQGEGHTLTRVRNGDETRAVTCSCSWSSPGHLSGADAIRAADEHLTRTVLHPEPRQQAQGELKERVRVAIAGGDEPWRRGTMVINPENAASEVLAVLADNPEPRQAEGELQDALRAISEWGHGRDQNAIPITAPSTRALQAGAWPGPEDVANFADAALAEQRQDQPEAPTAQAHTNGDCLPGCTYCADERRGDDAPIGTERDPYDEIPEGEHPKTGERAETVLAEIKAECVMWRSGEGESSEVLDEIAKLVGCPESEQ